MQFGTKMERYAEKYGMLLADGSEVEEGKNNTFEDAETNLPDLLTRSKVRTVDDEPYNQGGLVRCSTESASSRLRERQVIYLENQLHKFYSAAQRLHILLGGESHDIFAADINYHQNCYIKFAIKDIRDSKSESHINQPEIDDVLEIFLQRIKTKIVREKSAFLLNELLNDISFGIKK